MASAATKKTARQGADPTSQAVVQVAGFALVRTHPRRKSVEVPENDRATVLVAKAGAALRKPGIGRDVVFRDKRTGVIFSYSTYPADPTKVVRESADGTKRIGRLVNGKFIASKIAA